jgi:hypothetical protein
MVFTSICGAAVSFMLTFPWALLGEAKGPVFDSPSGQERTGFTPVSIELGGAALGPYA